MMTTALPEISDRDGFICPVCGFSGLFEAPYDRAGNPSHEICSCCGYEFGFDDHREGISHDIYRERWIAQGAAWFAPEERPDDWDLESQLLNLN